MAEGSASNSKSSRDIHSSNSSRIFYGWVILAAGFLAGIMAWGFYYSFGVFFEALQNAFQTNRADIALIASIIAFTIYIAGSVYGWAIERYGPRIPVGIGAGLLCLGLLLSSRASAVWQLYISLGILVGFGASATVVPFLSVLTRWFVKMRGLVIGIVSAGAGVGMMVMAPLSQNLLTSYGWRTSFVILGIASLVIFGIAAFLIRGHPEDKGLMPYGTKKSDDEEVSDRKRTAPATAIGSSRDVSFRAAIRGKDLWLVMGIRTVIALTIYTVSTHLVNYAKDGGMSPTNAALLMTIIGGVSIFGKIGAGHLADRVGSKKIVITCAATMVALMLWLSTLISGWMLPLFAVIYGLAYGGSFSTINTVVAEVFGVTEIARILGVVNIGTAAGSLVGPWLAGYVFDTTGSYSMAFVVASGASLAAVIFSVLLGKHAKKSIAVESQ